MTLLHSCSRSRWCSARRRYGVNVSLRAMRFGPLAAPVSATHWWKARWIAWTRDNLVWSALAM
eukprot:3630439-Heterocapsa_arctica.AAC.1